MQANEKPIAIFDSGVGGLSIYKELKRALPNENFVYLCDQKNIPYGGRSASEIRKLTMNCLKFLINSTADYKLQTANSFHNSSTDYRLQTTDFLPPKLIVIACNTSTVSGIEEYRRAFPIVPIIGVVPVVKTAAETTKNGRIAILSTVATASSDYQKNLIEKFCPNFKVINPFSPSYSFSSTDYRLLTTDSSLLLNIGCPNLVSFIENGITSGAKIKKELAQILKPVVDAHCDTLVLGCTHYPFLKKTINRLLNSKLETRNSKQKSKNLIFKNLNLKIVSNFEFRVSNFQILDSSGAISRQTTRILEKNNLLSTYPSSTSYTPSSIFLTTGDPQKFQEVIKKLMFTSSS